MNIQVSNLESEIIPPQLAVKAMRDSGYKNTAYALAELIDNSVQANASLVEVFCIERRGDINQRKLRRINEIAVFDNGKGMSAEILRMALQFGNGTYLKDRSGIGRFGMGLPNASISQCRRVDVWTWQNGIQNALYTYLCIDEIESAKLRNVPLPKPEQVPEEWVQRASDIGRSGTLIVWKNFDDFRLTWKGARATLQNTELLIGRMYRKFLEKGKLEIRLVALTDDEVTYEECAKVNDPLYLAGVSTTPSPFNNQPMFQKWGEEDKVFEIECDGRSYPVTVRISWAKKETVPEDRVRNRGDLPYGKHAAKNVGVSIVRADRELDLDATWANSYDPRERWWGAEIEFPPELDEIFGVTNNKQSATSFSRMSQLDWKSEMEPGEDFLDFKERLRAENDPRLKLIDITIFIQDQLSNVRSHLDEQTKGIRKDRKRYEEPSVEDRASSKFIQRATEGHKAESDSKVFDTAASENLTQDLIDDKKYPEKVAREIADAVKKRQRKVIFIEKENSESNAFFHHEEHGGVTQIIFNTDHPAHKELILALNNEVDENAQKDDLIYRIQNAADTLYMLFAAWARCEIEDLPNRNRIKEVRQNWGKMARIFLEDEK